MISLLKIVEHLHNSSGTESRSIPRFLPNNNNNNNSPRSLPNCDKVLNAQASLPLVKIHHSAAQVNRLCAGHIKRKNRDTKKLKRQAGKLDLCEMKEK